MFLMHDAWGNDLLSLELLRAIHDGIIDPAQIFGDTKTGTAPVYVICNSVPKAGTYLLLEVVKALGGFEDIGHHLHMTGIRKRGGNGAPEARRQIPALLSVAGLKQGMTCPAHIEYSFVIEDYMLHRPDHKMLFIVRDPRDIVISWVDFVYSSTGYAKSSAWNAYAQQQAIKNNTDDSSRITSSIDGVLTGGLYRFLPWVNSPACHTVRFEDLYTDLENLRENANEAPCLDRIIEYLGMDTTLRQRAVAALGKSRTSSGRARKIGVYKERMNNAQLERLRQQDFHKLVLDFGYDAT